MSKELYKRFRPKKPKDLIGQTPSVKSLFKKINRDECPHSVLLSGESGCGKTTIARMASKMLKSDKHDRFEINSGDFKGIENIRQIRNSMGRSPYGKCKVWILNEVHQYRKDAQDAMLQILEDTPNWVYFFLTTTDPHKLNKAIRTRCMDVQVSSLDSVQMEKLVKKILKRIKKTIPEEVMEKLIEGSNGSPRQALVLLDSVLPLKKEEDQIDVILNRDLETQAIELARALMKPFQKWSVVSKILKKVDEDPEKIRRLILAYGSTVALGGGQLSGRALTMMQIFSTNYYDVGKAGLIYDSHQMVTAGNRRK